MSEHDGPWADGTPAWIDLTTGDIDATKAFYGELFGWHYDDGSPEFGGYSMATLAGRPVAGLMPAMPGWSGPPAWQTYLATSDADTTAARIVEAGGTLAFPVMDVAGAGRMGVATDAAGHPLSFWQAGTTGGFGLVNQPGADVWNELMTTDYAGALAFYGAVFPVTFSELGGDAVDYSLILVEGREVGGLGAADADGFHGWRTYFAVASADEAVATVARLGGRVIQAASDRPFGRMAQLTDPQGAHFAVIQYTGEPAG